MAIREAAGSVTVEWFHHPAELARHAPDWRTLESAATHTHLSSYDFIAAWYRHYAGPYGGLPLVGVARRGAGLVGVAPLAICRARICGVPITRIELAPTDVPAGEFLTAGDDPEVIRAFVEAIIDDTAFDVASLDGFTAGSQELTAAENAAANRHVAVESVEHSYAMADLSRGYAHYYAQLSGQFRRKLNQRARTIAAAGGPGIDGIQFSGDADEQNRCVSRIIAITEASYKLQGAPLADCHRTFLSDVIAQLSARGTLCLPILTVGGEDAAFILGVVERGIFYDITLAYVDTFAKLSPGTYLMQKALERLASAGIHTVVSHGAHEYKKHWATRFVPQTRLLLFNRGIRGSVAHFVRSSVVPAWHRLRGVARAWHAGCEIQEEGGPPCTTPEKFRATRGTTSSRASATITRPNSSPSK